MTQAAVLIVGGLGVSAVVVQDPRFWDEKRQGVVRSEVTPATSCLTRGSGYRLHYPPPGRANTHIIKHNAGAFGEPWTIFRPLVGTALLVFVELLAAQTACMSVFIRDAVQQFTAGEVLGTFWSLLLTRYKCFRSSSHVAIWGETGHEQY